MRRFFVVVVVVFSLRYGSNETALCPEKNKEVVAKENKISRKMYFSSDSSVLTVWPGYKTGFLYDKVKSRYTNSF